MDKIENDTKLADEVENNAEKVKADLNKESTVDDRCKGDAAAVKDDTDNKDDNNKAGESDVGEEKKSPSIEVDNKGAEQQEAVDEAPPPTKRLRQHVKTVDEQTDEEKKITSTRQEGAVLDKELRKFERIPVFVVDYHNDVLEFIYRCLATRHLPLHNNILVHFDSHPDMVISREIPASASFDKETMLAELSIENWIMPACYAGHFNRVVWLKNSWCQQMPVGKYNFKIGQKDNRIRVDCPLDYFISEGNYSVTSEMQDTRDMQLHVYNMNGGDSEKSDSHDVDPCDFLKPEDATNFVLDIDLDFFSTSNPFLEIYKDANCYEQLSDIFHFEAADRDCGGTTERRKLQLEALKRVFEHLEEVRSFEGLEAPDSAIVSNETFAKIKNLAQSLQKHYPDDEIDWLLIYDSGSTTDTNGLPHHISTAKELEQYLASFKRFLRQLPIPPIAITMACSAEDDYCPKDQVGFIEEQVLIVLRDVFGERLHDKPILHYLDEEWDVMQL